MGVAQLGVGYVQTHDTYHRNPLPVVLREVYVANGYVAAVLRGFGSIEVRDVTTVAAAFLHRQGHARRATDLHFRDAAECDRHPPFRVAVPAAVIVVRPMHLQCRTWSVEPEAGHIGDFKQVIAFAMKPTGDGLKNHPWLELQRLRLRAVTHEERLRDPGAPIGEGAEHNEGGAAIERTLQLLRAIRRIATREHHRVVRG